MKECTEYLHIDSPLGRLELKATNKRLTAIRFDHFERQQNYTSYNEILRKTKKQLTEYFNGERTEFDLPIKLTGTAFEKDVWNKLSCINYGSTITYSELAGQLGGRGRVRAVGRANGKNRIPIIIPCHRVIGASGKMVGYSGGIERKKILLQHEGALLL